MRFAKRAKWLEATVLYVKLFLIWSRFTNNRLQDPEADAKEVDL